MFSPDGSSIAYYSTDERALKRVAVSGGAPVDARALGTPKPWGVTALFAEYTGAHPPLEIDWSLEREVRSAAVSHESVTEPVATEESSRALAESPTRAGRPADHAHLEQPRGRPFSTFWEFAVAVNRSDSAALALASNGVTSDIPFDETEVRRLINTMWFRSVKRDYPGWGAPPRAAVASVECASVLSVCRYRARVTRLRGGA